jgi:hypothetical protein
MSQAAKNSTPMTDSTETPTALSDHEANSIRCADVCIKREKYDLARLILQGMHRKLTTQEKGKVLCGLIDMIGEKKIRPNFETQDSAAYRSNKSNKSNIVDPEEQS